MWSKLVVAILLCAASTAAQVVNPSTGGNGTGSGASPVVGWYLSPNCPAANTGQCFNTPANTRFDNTCSWTNASPTITCSDGPFTAADPTKQAWGFSSAAVGTPGCSPYQAIVPAFITAAHGVVATFVSATQITLTGNPVNSSVNSTSCFIWGTPDDAGATALETAYGSASSCPKVTLAAGYYLFTTTHFTSQPTACANLPAVFNTNNPGPNSVGNVILNNGFELEGRGVGTTVIVIPPDFPQSGVCNFGIGGQACFHVPGIGYFHDFAITSGSGRGGLPNNKSLIEVDVGSLGYFTCNGVGAVQSSGTIGIEVGVAAQLQSINNSDCGATGLRADTNTGSGGGYTFGYPMTKCYRCSIENSAPQGGQNYLIQNGARFGCHSCMGWGSQGAGAGIAVWTNQGGELWLEDALAFQQTVTNPVVMYQATTNAGSILHLINSVFGRNSTGVPTNGIQCLVACTNYISDSYIVASGAANTGVYTDVAGSKLFDLGGNIFTGTAGDTINGAVFGSDSITGTTLVVGNVVLAGLGTGVTAPSSASGNSLNGQFTFTIGAAPGANGTATVTFPTAFLVAPTCSASVVGGTSATVLLPEVGSLTATGMVITYTGTFVTGTVITRYSCAN